MSAKPICPFLPEPDEAMNHMCLTEVKKSDQGRYYYTALKYGNYLWREGHAGRAILAITKALYTDLPYTHPIYTDWPLPYAALHWLVATHDSDDFPGNPRISFQHQATRMKPEHSDIKRTRAWAVWALVCEAKPSLPGDISVPIEEPTLSEIEALLKQHGQPNEAETWKKALG